MTKPKQYLVRMVLFLLVVLIVIGMLYIPLYDAFSGNALLNGLIICVLLVGILYNFRQVLSLSPEVDWINDFRAALDNPNQRQASLSSDPPKLLAPMAMMVGQKETFTLSSTAMRSLLDGILSRLDESRDISRYIIGLLIFLGLLGTFWGLLGTVASIGDVIGNLSVAVNDSAAIFGDLKKGLNAPLVGMGTAFSSSLFGLAGSLVLGFLDLQANQAQNRFFNELEDWLSTVTRLSSGAMSGDGDHSMPAYVQALLEQTADSLEALQRTLTKGEESRISANDTIRHVGDKLDTLAEHMRTEHMLMKSVAESQLDMKPILTRLVEMNVQSSDGMDETTKQHIRSLDLQLNRLTGDLSSGREEILQHLRSEIKLLARTIAGSGSNS